MDITEKIKHLLAIANDPSASEAEREQAMNRAHAWMLKHGVDVALDENPQASTMGHVKIDVKGVYAESMSQMLFLVADSYGSFSCLMEPLPRTSSVVFWLAGPKDLMPEVIKLLDSIREQADEARKGFMKLMPPMSRTLQKRHIASFYEGFGMKVSQRIEEIKDHEVSQMNQKALVVMRGRSGEHLLEAIKDEKGYEGTTKTVGSRPTAQGYSAGMIAGAKAKLNDQLR